MARTRAVRMEDKRHQLVQLLMQRIARSTARRHEGKVTYLIGNNGTGKSRLLAELAERLSITKPTRIVACIASSIHDRFTFGDHGRNGQVRYLGARNAPNAVFQAAVDRQLSRFILQAMSKDPRRFKHLSDAASIDLSFLLSRKSIESLDQLPPKETKANTRLRKRAQSRNLLAPGALAMLRRIAEGSGRFERLTKAQIPTLLAYLDLGVDIELAVALPEGRSIRFTDLSTGEQNRILLFAKVLGAMDEGTVFLIDEPEISLHLHWQMELHERLMGLLAKLSRVHVVIATHAPVIISEAARYDKENLHNVVAVLDRVSEKKHTLAKDNSASGKFTFKLHSFAEVSSHEQLVLRQFHTAPYQAREVAVEIAEAVLRVAEGDERGDKAIEILHLLRGAKGLSAEAEQQIDAAILLIERDLVTSIKQATSA